MLMQEERELVVEYGRKMSTDRLSTGTSGNISVCNAEKGLMAISPSGMDYFSTTPEDVVITDLEANIVDGVRKPSSEWALHTAFYRHKPHARAVVHTHSMYCTTFAVLGQPLRAVHYAIGDTGAATVPCAPYRLFGTAELAEAAIEACGGSDAVLLSNHGLVACGRDTEEYNGFVIQDACIGCGACASACPQKCITPGTPYVINWAHCLQCGRCAEACPADAVRRLHP